MMVEFDEHVPVTLHGKRYVWVRWKDNSGPLAPYEHVDNNLNITWENMLEESYAHVFVDGNIWRHGVVIAHRDELIIEEPK